MLKNIIEKKREEMHRLADKYGFMDERVLEKSRELDTLLNKHLIEHLYSNRLRREK